MLFWLSVNYLAPHIYTFCLTDLHLVKILYTSPSVFSCGWWGPCPHICNTGTLPTDPSLCATYCIIFNAIFSSDFINFLWCYFLAPWLYLVEIFQYYESNLGFENSWKTLFHQETSTHKQEHVYDTIPLLIVILYIIRFVWYITVSFTILRI